MNSLNIVYYKIKPVFHTFIFEIRLQIKKFVIFSGMTILLLFLNSYIPYVLNTPLESSQVNFYEYGNSYFILIIVLAVSFFFGGIICSEFKNKTGLQIIPLTNRFKLIIGKYCANLILIIGIITIHYLTMALFAYNFYGRPLLKTLFYSFGFAVLYTLALSSIATFLSSFMPSITPVILTMVGYIFIGDSLIGYITITWKVEPLYSLGYIYYIVKYILYPDFSTMDRLTPIDERWLFPSIEGALTLLSIYTVIFFILGIILFKRREF
ncbi:hypothetical protein LCGC14_0860860 [marine sediment metagenome]|uniref:ABC-2 type transporter domain-containing protein n=1 Tax=marine sediment metagenome TaxID=412755 RepID=A0A0F9PSW3_9ZZZZ